MSVAKTLGLPLAGFALVSSVWVPLQPASAQSAPNDPLWWAPAAIAHAQKMRVFKDADNAAQSTPSTIPVFEAGPDPSGMIATYQPRGPTTTSSNAFFQNLGTNGRSCFTCHQPQTGWGVSAADVQARFTATSGADPIFRVFDGATCPSDKVTTLAEKRVAYELLTGRGLIRIGLPMPPNAQFEITHVDDPYKCSNNRSIGTAGIYSFYRRPLPASNARFLTDLQWDGRQPNLKSQAIMATLVHEQATIAPTETQLSQIISFESGIYTAQDFDANANSLYALSATGGPRALSKQAFLESSETFDLYSPWAKLTGRDRVTQARLSVARGQQLFNANCNSCHDVQDAGDNFYAAFFNTNVAYAGNANSATPAPPVLDISGLPIFTVQCKLNGVTYFVTDLGRAMITGQCEDIANFKVHTLRGLAARAPYFHNGSAATLVDVVSFYNAFLALHLTEQQKSDLINFLKTL